MEERKFIVQTPRAVIDKGKLALIFGLVFTIPVLIFTAIFDTWNTSAKVLGLGALLTGTGIIILLTHRSPRLEVYGSRLRSSAPGLHNPVHLPFGVPPGGGFPLVIEFLALGQTDLQLDPGAPEVDRQRDKGVAERGQSSV